MKKLFAVILASAVLFTSVCNSPASESQKHRVAVADLVISEAVSSKQADIVRKSSLISDIENAIRNSRKFELLTRRSSTLSAIRKEQVFAKSSLSLGDSAQEGLMANAQSIIHVEVTQFSHGRSARRVPNTEKYRISDTCLIELSVQILDTERASVMASFPIKASSATGTSIANSIGAAGKEVLDKTLEKAAGSLANQLSDTIFPITILQNGIKGKRFWVNRGNDSGLKIGELFEIFEPGETLIDPKTGENLGSAETEIGKARVVRINPKVTQMEMTEGDPSYLQPEFILRRPVK